MVKDHLKILSREAGLNLTREHMKNMKKNVKKLEKNPYFCISHAQKYSDEGMKDGVESGSS